MGKAFDVLMPSHKMRHARRPSNPSQGLKDGFISLGRLITTYVTFVSEESV
jgi:hypothetical protein